MHEGLGQLLNHLPPKTAGALVQAINRCGAQLEIGPDWVRRWIGFTVVADALAQYKPNVFELKGGAAIELRLRRYRIRRAVRGSDPVMLIGLMPWSNEVATASARASPNVQG